jgi:flagellar hook protein FlgE
MDVIGNNIANVNTIGFKRGRVNFQDMVYQYMGGASRPTDELGGVNPKQVGLGMMVSAIDTIHTQGSLQSTGVVSDVAIQGNGFFIMRAGNKELYTRAGAFGLDAQGVLVNPANGMRVQGWQAETINGVTILDTSSDVTDLLIPIGSKDPAQMTTEVEFACNLDKRTPVIPEGAAEETIRQNTWVVNKVVYDTFGNEHTLRMEFSRVPETTNQWQVQVFVDGDVNNPDAPNPTNTRLEVGAVNNADNRFILQFDNYGALESVQDAQGDILNTGTLIVPVTFDVPESNAVVTEAGPAIYTQTFNLNLGEIGSYTESITQQAETSSTKAFRQNGYGMGYLETYRIDQNGMITGVFTNGQNRALGQLALATFINPNGLEKTGETNFMRTINSGDALIGPANVAGKGKFISGALEMSNVDLAEQFVDMIVTQRGFQANSKGIQTSDTMLQELLTLKR